MATATAALAPVKRPAGIAVLSGLLLLSALLLLARTLALHVAGLQGLFRLVAVLVLGLVGYGIWSLRNNARAFLFFLLTSDVLGCLTALFLYALRQAHYRLAVYLVIETAIALLLLWYLQSETVRHAFGGFSPWPTTVKMLVLTTFTVLLAFPFYWMVIAAFKQNIDLYGMENNPFVFNLPPTLDNLRLLFMQTRHLPLRR